MGVFFFIDDRLVNLHEPAVMVKDKYYGRFAEKDFAPFILSELCAMDMLYAVTNMRDGYYREARLEGRAVCQKRRTAGKPSILV